MSVCYAFRENLTTLLARREREEKRVREEGRGTEEEGRE